MAKKQFAKVRDEYLKSLKALIFRLENSLPIDLNYWYKNQFFPIFRRMLFQPDKLKRTRNKRYEKFVMFLSNFRRNESAGFVSPYTELLDLIETIRLNWGEYLFVRIVDLPPQDPEDLYDLDDFDRYDKKVVISVY